MNRTISPRPIKPAVNPCRTASAPNVGLKRLLLNDLERDGKRAAVDVVRQRLGTGERREA